jgi:hypothetical protein
MSLRITNRNITLRRDSIKATATVKNTGSQSAQREVSLHLDGHGKLSGQALSIPGGGSKQFSVIQQYQNIDRHLDNREDFTSGVDTGGPVGYGGTVGPFSKSDLSIEMGEPSGSLYTPMPDSGGGGSSDSNGSDEEDSGGSSGGGSNGSNQPTTVEEPKESDETQDTQPDTVETQPADPPESESQNSGDTTDQPAVVARPQPHVWTGPVDLPGGPPGGESPGDAPETGDEGGGIDQRGMIGGAVALVGLAAIATRRGS